MAFRKKFESDESRGNSSDYDSEQELPERGQHKMKQGSTGMLGDELNPKHPLFGENKPVTFSSNRRKRSQNRKAMQAVEMEERDIPPAYSQHTKTVSQGTTKEPSRISNPPLRKQYLSTSNKVSERQEEDEESSNKTKQPRLKFENNNIMDLCDKLDDIHEEEHSEKPVKKQRSDFGTMVCFITICITNILVNVDHGCIPACTVKLKHDLGLDNASLGVLGSVVYCGLLVGSFASPPIFHCIPVKYIILWCILFNMVCLVGFTLFVDFFILCGFRFGVGFFQVFLCIYFPVWIDCFGKENQKTIWLTILQSSVPLGVVMGYGVTAILNSEFGAWQYSYHLQAMVYAVIFLIFACIPKDYIEDNSEEKEEEGEVKDAKESDQIREVYGESDGYLSASESASSDDGYECEMSSKADISSIGLSCKGKKVFA